MAPKPGEALQVVVKGRMRSRPALSASFAVFFALVAASCANEPKPPPPSVPAAPPKPAKAPPPPAAETAAAPIEPLASAPVPAAAPPPPPVPPPAFEGPHERTRTDKDGKWEPYIQGPDGEPALLYKTTVHPDPIKRFLMVTIVAIDLTRTEVSLVAGTTEPATTTVDESKRTGLVPPDRLDDLLVVFNGGFMTKHGKYGIMIDGEEFFPPREDACVMARRKDGAFFIGPFAEIKDKTAELSYYRQTPACMIDKGQLSPDLSDSYKHRKWGGQDNGRKDTRRSAVGLDASGKVLFYGLGEEVFPKDIAFAMQSAGAVSAAQLDINWSYTRFLVMGRPKPSDPLQVVSTLIPKLKHLKRGYVETASSRDFFYVAKKPAPAGNSK